MSGYSFKIKDVQELKQSLDAGMAPKGVIDILTEEEIEVLDILHPESLTSEDRQALTLPLSAIMAAVRGQIFENTALPPEFPTDLLSDSFSKYSSNIAILTSGDFDEKHVQDWVLEVLAAAKSTTKEKISACIRFESRTWFDGQVSVEFMAKEKVDLIANSLPVKDA